ncbi:glutathione S-transferase family protein [Pontibacterium granulatum]|uniref:glutathione S-transferase family protein n=1 Tax=Pontibacterium granulatum TaxID=2036029 RepID=UPI00249C0AF8|nr:glutathione S-transferase family protein [Pontibacterium granulatum]MDI3324793.1 glutathione S-transferase family protein [Pontibacterium granulatum]
MLKFYFHPTPNPMKVALFLEEAGLSYELVPVDTLKGEQHTPEYKSINPNSKVPAIDDDGTVVFDSTAILLYLAEKHDVFLGAKENRGELLSWLMFIATGLGPYSGQAVHFQRSAPENIPYAVNRYRKEAIRHYQVLNDRLEGRDFLVGDCFTLADISAWGWIDRVTPVLGEGELENFPELQRWFTTVDARPSVKKTRALAQEYSFKSDMDEEAKRALFPQNYQ